MRMELLDDLLTGGICSDNVRTFGWIREISVSTVTGLQAE